MNKVRNIANDGELTKGKIYDVIKTKINNHFLVILVLNDLGEEKWYITKGPLSGKPYFIDVTSEYRDEVIDGILK